MSYEVAMRVRDGLLRVDFSGERMEEGLEEQLRTSFGRIADVCREKELNRILLLSSATGPYSTPLAYRMSSMLDKLGFQHGWKMAYVNPDPEVREVMHFAETVALNRGIHGRVFDTEEQALEWLFSDPSAP